MPITTTLPDWAAAGIQPPESLRTNGWQEGQKPAAEYFNWFFSTAYFALKDLSEQAASQQDLDTHTSNISNPHQVTKGQVGLGNVTNDQQATKLNFDNHVANTLNPHGVTKSQVGLGNVDNVKQETPSGAQQKANVAEQAAIDWAKSFGLGDTAELYSGDFNQLYKSGFYYGQSTALNRPQDTNGFCIVTSLDSSYIIQVYFISGGSFAGNMYKRICSNGVWNSWVEMETTAGAQKKATEVKDWAKSMGLGTPSRFSGDINTISSNGLFYIGTDCTNQPTGAGYLIHQGHPGMDNASQFYIDYLSNGVFTRTRDSNAVWTNWIKIAVDSEVIHKSGDEMTGSLIMGDQNISFTDADGNTWNLNGNSSGLIQITKSGTAGAELQIENKTADYAQAVLRIGGKQMETESGAQAKADTAEQAAINWAKSFGLGTRSKNISNQDLNDYATAGSGFYVGDNLINRPPYTKTPHGWDYIIMVSYAESRVLQIVTDLNNTETWQRIYNGAVWGSWVQQETTEGAQAKADAVQDWAKGYGLGALAKRIDYTIDNIPGESGFYYLLNGAINGSPNGSNGYILHQAYSTLYKKQMFMPANSNEVFQRISDSTGWKPWLHLVNEGSNVSFASVTVDGVDLKQSVSNGKQQVRDAVIGKGSTVADADSDGIPTFQELTDGVNGITTSPIKSIQRGLSSTVGDTRVVAIDAVDLSKSIVVCHGFYTDDGGTVTVTRNKILAKFNSPTEISLGTHLDFYGAARYFSWEVIEFVDDVNVQSGYLDVSGDNIGDGDQIINISAVDISKSMVFFNYRLAENDAAGHITEWIAELIDSTTLHLKRGIDAERSIFQWFVVEFP